MEERYFVSNYKKEILAIENIVGAPCCAVCGKDTVLDIHHSWSEKRATFLCPNHHQILHRHIGKRDDFNHRERFLSIRESINLIRTLENKRKPHYTKIDVQEYFSKTMLWVEDLLERYLNLEKLEVLALEVTPNLKGLVGKLDDYISIKKDKVDVKVSFSMPSEFSTYLLPFQITSRVPNFSKFDERKRVEILNETKEWIKKRVLANIIKQGWKFQNKNIHNELRKVLKEILVCYRDNYYSRRPKEPLIKTLMIEELILTEPVCIVCGYTTILELHHFNESKIGFLCPNHHAILHRILGSSNELDVNLIKKKIRLIEEQGIPYYNEISKEQVENYKKRGYRVYRVKCP